MYLIVFYLICLKYYAAISVSAASIQAPKALGTKTQISRLILFTFRVKKYIHYLINIQYSVMLQAYRIWELGPKVCFY